jgi:hypothetical protein
METFNDLKPSVCIASVFGWIMDFTYDHIWRVQSQRDVAPALAEI